MCWGVSHTCIERLFLRQTNENAAASNWLTRGSAVARRARVAQRLACLCAPKQSDSSHTFITYPASLAQLCSRALCYVLLRLCARICAPDPVPPVQVLGFLNQKRPSDIDRDSVYLQADAFAVLVQMDFVAADGEGGLCAVLCRAKAPALCVLHHPH